MTDLITGPLRIGLDLDDCVFDFWGAYIERFGQPKSDAEITYNVQNKLRKDKDFWLNLEVINTIDFIPTLYCTKRVSAKRWTRQALLNAGYPDAPIYQMYYQHGQKSTMIKGRVDVFVDDSLKNFIEMNLNGVPCLLMDCGNNLSWGPVGRIFSLDYDEIEDGYHLLRNTIGDNFRNLL